MAVDKEAQVQKLLGIPSHWAVAAVIPLGKPLKQLTRLKRKPVEEILFTDGWDG
jgi:nitroreductase